MLLGWGFHKALRVEGNLTNDDCNLLNLDKSLSTNNITPRTTTTNTPIWTSNNEWESNIYLLHAQDIRRLLCRRSQRHRRSVLVKSIGMLRNTARMDQVLCDIIDIHFVFGRSQHVHINRYRIMKFNIKWRYSNCNSPVTISHISNLLSCVFSCKIGPSAYDITGLSVKGIFRFLNFLLCAKVWHCFFWLKKKN